MSDKLQYWENGLPVELLNNTNKSLVYWENGLPFIEFDPTQQETTNPPQKRRIFLIE
jgi:hypothetical protein